MLPWDEMGQKRVFITGNFNLESVKMFPWKLQDPKFKRQFRTLLETAIGRGLAVHPPSNGKGIRSTQHSMGMLLDTRFYI